MNPVLPSLAFMNHRTPVTNRSAGSIAKQNHAVVFGNGSPTREDADTARLVKLMGLIESKIKAGLVEFKGAMIKEKESDPDLAKLLVRDAAGGQSRIYIVSRYIERLGPVMDDGLPMFSKKSYMLVMYDPNLGYSNPQRVLRLMDGPGEADEVAYTDFSVPPGQEPIEAKSQKAPAILAMRSLMDQMERKGMFNPNAALQNELENLELDF
jgi:hypothetical protein